MSMSAFVWISELLHSFHTIILGLLLLFLTAAKQFPQAAMGQVPSVETLEHVCVTLKRGNKGQVKLER